MEARRVFISGTHDARSGSVIGIRDLLQTLVAWILSRCSPDIAVRVADIVCVSVFVYLCSTFVLLRDIWGRLLLYS